MAQDPSMGLGGLGGGMDLGGLGGDPSLGLGMGMGGDSQAEIAQFMAEQRARKRTKMFIYLGVGVVLAGVAGFFIFKSHQKTVREETVAKFFSEWRKVDDGAVSDFWKCTVRAKQRDVRLASQASEITEGLEKAFANFPKSQPGRLLDKCIPMLPAAVEEAGKLKPPEGFAAPLEDYKKVLNFVADAFTGYAKMIEKRKQEASDEQEIREGHSHFHQVISGGGFASVADTPKAVAYFNVINCAVPDLMKNVRKISRPPDTQYVVEYIYNTCKADPQFANKLRKECFEQRNSTSMRTPEFKAAANKMSGDDRDLYAINDCFKRINHGFAFEELKKVAEAFGKYRNEGRRKILEALDKVKKELAD